MEMAALVDAYGRVSEQRDVGALRALLADGFTCRLEPEARELDRDGYIAFQAEYPGGWTFDTEELVVAADRAVQRSRVTGDGAEYVAAMFFTASGGRLTRLVEVWVEVKPARR